MIEILVGLVLLAGGAEALVRGSSSIALRMGITPLVIGLTVVAMGTGSPELLVSVQAALRGSSDLALGNIVGSNISNIALILGVSAVLRPMHVQSQLIKREVPLMIAVTLFFSLLIVDGSVSRLDGAVLLSAAAAYVLASYLSARRERNTVTAEDVEEVIPPVSPPWRSWALVLLGLGALVLGAGMLVGGASDIAMRLGVSQVVIGLTIVAIGTSLPELATSAVAAVRGQADIAFGNVIGSNILNILMILGITALISPIDVTGLRRTDLAVFIASAVLLLPLMWRGAVLNRWEGGLLLCGYLWYMTTLA